MATKKSSTKPKVVKTKATPKKPAAKTALKKVGFKAAFIKTKPITFASLRKWNLTLSGLHAAQGVLVLLLSVKALFPVSTNYLALDPLQTAAQEKPVLTLAQHQLFDINLAYLIAAFFFMSALAHLFVATRYRRQYEAGLGQGVNKVRWYEYALSASTMMVAIGLLVGVQDISVILALFAFTAVMNLCGLIMETHNGSGQPVKWLSYIVGSIAGAVPWLIIAIYLWGGAVYGSKAPTFVYWIFVSIFLFFMSFAVNMVLQYKRTGKWANYLYGERVYMILSLVAKSLLAWQVFAGALRP